MVAEQMRVLGWPSLDARLDHGGALHPHEEGGGRVRDEELVQVERLVNEVVRR